MSDPREEILDVVDDADVVVGRARRADVYDRRLRHRTVMIVVRDPAGRVLVHRRTDTKLVLAGYHDMMVGGVVDAGETYDAAAARELAEEVGVAGVPLRRVAKFRYDPAPAEGAYPQWIALYETTWAGEVVPQPSEVAWWDWLAEADLDRAIQAGAWRFCPDSLAGWSRYRAGG